MFTKIIVITVMSVVKSSSLHSLNIHVTKYHGKKRIYSCNMCEVKVTRDDLKNHKEATHGVKLISCDFCKFKTEYLDSVIRHTRTVHKENNT